MIIKSIKKHLTLSVAVVAAIPTILVLFNIYYIFRLSLGGNTEGTKTLEFIRILQIEAIVSVVVILAFIGLYFLVRRSVFDPLSEVKQGVQAMKNGNLSYRFKVDSDSEIVEIAGAFNDMAENMEQSYKKLEAQAVELYDRNWELQELNAELEASYGQLQAIIEQLNEAEQKYHSLIKNIPEMVCVIEKSGTISFANQACGEVLGYEKSEIVSRSIFDIIDGESGNIVFENLLKELEDKSSVTIELGLIRKDGEKIVTEATFTNHVIDGVNLGLQSIIRDITQKRKMEEEITQRHNELGILNSVSKSLTSTLDLDNLSQHVVNEISRTLKFPACVLRLVDKSGTVLQAKAYSGAFFESLQGIQDFENISMGDELLGRVVNSSEIMSTTYIDDSWLLGRINKTRRENLRIKELMFVPVNVKNKKVGVLAVGSYSNIQPRDISLVSSIANNAAIAIDNALLYETSKKYFIKTIDALIAAVEAKDKYTEGHSQRVAKYSVLIAEKLGLAKEEVEDVKIAGILHDIGKIGISDNILQKAGKLTEDEYEQIKQHPSISNKILYPVGFSERTLKAIALHHERFDGRGYPFGLNGDNISIEAQIIAVADAFDAMTSSRSYRRAMSGSEAIKELLANSGTQFSSKVVNALIDMRDQFEEV